MAQNPAQFCPQCGAPIQAGQRFCSNCGATIGASAAAPTAAASYIPIAPDQASGSGMSEPTVPDNDQSPISGHGPYSGSTQAVAPPPPPTASAYNPYENSPPGGPQVYEQSASITPGYIPPPAGGTYTPVPAYAQAPRRSRGCLVTSLILLLVLAAGIGGFLIVNARLNQNPKSNSSNTSATSGANTGSTSGNNSGSTSGSSSGGQSSEQLNLKITYASITVTIASAQLAGSFSDDHSSNGQAGVVRLNLHEMNPTTGNPRYLESDVLLLVLPDGSTVQSSNQQQFESPDGGVSRDNWVDFAMNNQVKLNQLTLRVGKQSENQMNIPLQPNADMSKYQDKTSNPNAQFQYSGLNWTLKTAMLSYSYADAQATTGNRYVVITLSVANHTSNTFRGYPGDYIRLQEGSITQGPDTTFTFPLSVDAQSTGSGTFAFLMPDGATSFTLIMLGQPNASPPIPQVTQNFQIH